jgi:hypothetical protein
VAAKRKEVAHRRTRERAGPDLLPVIITDTSTAFGQPLQGAAQKVRRFRLEPVALALLSRTRGWTQ